MARLKHKKGIFDFSKWDWAAHSFSTLELYLDRRQDRELSKEISRRVADGLQEQLTQYESIYPAAFIDDTSKDAGIEIAVGLPLGSKQLNVDGRCHVLFSAGLDQIVKEYIRDNLEDYYGPDGVSRAKIARAKRLVTSLQGYIASIESAVAVAERTLDYDDEPAKKVLVVKAVRKRSEIAADKNNKSRERYLTAYMYWAGGAPKAHIARSLGVSPSRAAQIIKKGYKYAVADGVALQAP